MKLLLALAALCCALVAVADTPRWPTAEANRHWPLKAERIRAYREHDRAFFERVLAEDFVGLAPNGAHQTRASYLEAEFGAERAGAPATDTTVEDFTATRTGSTLILRYRETERTRVGDADFEVHLARLDVYARRAGRWQLLAMTAVRLPEAPTTIAVPPRVLADYAGRYRFGPDIVSTVRVDGTRLREQTTGNPEGDLLPVAPDTFYAPPDLEARVLFERDANGHVVAQIYQSGAQRLRAPRVD